VFSCNTIGGVGRCGEVDAESSLVEEGTYESGTGPTIMGIRTVAGIPGAFPPVVGCVELEVLGQRLMCLRRVSDGESISWNRRIGDTRAHGL
jgi:hypothetical protein